LPRNITTISELIEPFAHYPKAVQQAILLVDSHPSISLILTRATSRVLKSIVSRCNKEDGCAPVYARAPNLAKEADCDARTVTRALKALSELGWIEKLGDGRDDGGKYRHLEVRLTETLAKLLRLPVEGKRAHRTEMSDGPYIGFYQSVFTEDYPGTSEQKPQPQNPTPPAAATGERPPISLPPELSAAGEQLDISPKGIAKLRGEACRAGYNLAHIVTCARQYLLNVGIKNGRAFRYLQKMIAQPSVDYAARAEQAGREAVQGDLEGRVTAVAQKLAGRAYRERDGHTYRFRADGRVEILNGGTFLGFLPMDQVEDVAKRLEAAIAKGSQAQPAAPGPSKPASSSSAIQGHISSMLALLKPRSAPVAVGA